MWQRQCPQRPHPNPPPKGEGENVQEASLRSLPKPRAILFDWDNTLVDTWPLIHAALNMTLRHMDKPEWTYEMVCTQVKQSMRESFPGLFGDRWQEAATFYQKSYRSIHLEKLQPLLGAEDMLKSVPAEVFLGIISNKVGETLRTELTHIGWPYFRVAIGAGDASRDKPDPGTVALALKDSGITPAADVWFVGDTSIDIECANAASCTPILYGEATQASVDAEKYPYAVHVKDHQALMDLIKMSC